jgi:UDP-glucuronate decarboxylase
MALDDGRVVSNFIIQALKNEDITVYGSGSQTRSFQYVDDLIDGLVRLMNTPPDFIGPLNLGNPAEYKIIDLAQKIIELTESKSKIQYNPLPQDDPVQRNPDISMAREMLDGWEPTIGLEEGLQKTITYFRNVLKK